jgi:hypothetical protein
MDFKPFKKDRKPGPDGHYDWESPGLRARIDEAKRLAKPAPTRVPFEAKNWADQAMINRDEKQWSVCHLPPLPPQEPNHGPWVRWEFDMENIPQGVGKILLGSGSTFQTQNLLGWGWNDHNPDDNIVAYCLKELPC